MTQFLIRRIFWAIFLFLVATIITYLIFWVIPSNPAALAAGKSATPADIARVSHFLHLDEPIWKQYLASCGSSSATARSASRSSTGSPSHDHQQGRPGHRLARLRRRRLLAVAFDPGRHPLGAAAALDHRPRHDDASS